MATAKQIRRHVDALAKAKDRAQDLLEHWPDCDVATGELEHAIELLGRVIDDMDDAADRSEATDGR